MVGYLNPVDKNPSKLGKINREFAKQLDLKKIEFPFEKKDHAKFEKNNIRIKKKPYHIYTSEQIFCKHVDLLLILNIILY